MKLTVTVKQVKHIDATAIRCVLPVDYDDEDMPLDYPFRKDDEWDITIDIRTGQIRDWPSGVAPLNLYMKVRDGGCYYLLSDAGVEASIDQNYVPACVPGDYGDYIDFRITSDGRIANWEPDRDEIVSSFFPDEN